MKIKKSVSIRSIFRCAKAATNGPAENPSRSSTARSRVVDTDAGITGYGEVCPLGPAYLPAYAAGRARGNRRNRSSSDWRDALPTRKAQPPHGCRAQGTPLRQIGAGHRLLGHFRAIRRPAALRAVGRALRQRRRALPRDLSGVPRGDGRPRPGIPRRGLPALPTESRRRARNGYRAHPRGRGRAPARRPPRRRRQHRLADARRDAGSCAP